MLITRNDTLEDINDMLREQAELAMQANQSLREDLCKVNDELGKVLAERDTERDFTRHKEQVIIIKMIIICKLTCLCFKFLNFIR